jgi:Nif-specific regulatory protein
MSEDDTRLSKLESLVELAQILGQQSDFDKVLRLVVEKASSLTRSDTALIMMVNPRTRDTIKTLYAQRRADDDSTHFLHTNITGWVLVNNASLLSPDLECDSRFLKRVLENVRVQSAICVPLRAGNAIIGTLLLTTERGTYFAEGDLVLIEELSAIAAPFLHSAHAIAEYFEPGLPRQALLNKFAALGLYGRGNKFVELLRSIEAASRCDVRVLLEGESGTGKELIARAVHLLSGRCENRFIAVDCGAIQPNLVESELFGHVKGAFTGASANRIGLFEEADGGTLFLDELNNLPMEMQSKLLRVLQDQEIRPVGSNTTRKVNVRIVTASSCSLRMLVDEKKFREDLFYRLNVYPVVVPSLKGRPEDIPLLAEHFLKRCCSEQKKVIEGFEDEVMDFIKHRRWAGNVRELENFIERVVTLATRNQNVIAVGIPEGTEEAEESPGRGDRHNTS